MPCEVCLDYLLLTNFQYISSGVDKLELWNVNVTRHFKQLVYGLSVYSLYSNMFYKGTRFDEIIVNLILVLIGILSYHSGAKLTKMYLRCEVLV